MIKSNLASRLATTVLFACLAGCATSKENHYYVLTPMDGDGKTVEQHINAEVPQINITVPAYLDRAQIVFISQNGDVDIHEYDRWAEPIDGMIQRVITEDLQALGPAVPRGNGRAAPRVVSLIIDDFSFANGAASLRAHWTDTAKGAGTSARAINTTYDFSASLTANGQDLTSLIVAMSQLAGQLAQKIAGSQR